MARPRRASAKAAPSAEPRAPRRAPREAPRSSWPPRGVEGWLRHLFIEGPTYLELMRDAWCTFDRRTLGFSRICLGFLLVMDLFRRTPDWMSMFATTGVLPASLNLSRPQAGYAFSIVNGFVTPPELVALWIVMLVTFV